MGAGRLIRLVPQDLERTAIRDLLNYRLPADNSQARLEWYSIVEGTHALWKGVCIPQYSYYQLPL
jgi:hypothetical protein